MPAIEIANHPSPENYYYTAQSGCAAYRDKKLAIITIISLGCLNFVIPSVLMAVQPTRALTDIGSWWCVANGGVVGISVCAGLMRSCCRSGTHARPNSHLPDIEEMP